MRRFVAPLAFAGLLALPSGSAKAQTDINFLAQFAPAGTVLYLPFEVSVGGVFQMSTSGLNHIDPMIRLFTGGLWTGAGLGTPLAVNDDNTVFGSAGWNACTGVGGSCQSYLSMFLNPGSYALALSVFNFTESEAWIGNATFGKSDLAPGTGYFVNGVASPYCNEDLDWSDCNYNVDITSVNGQALAAVPEPASLVLLGTGLAGLGGFAKRRRKKNGAA